MIRRQLWPWLVAAAGGLAIGVAAFSLTTGSGDGADGPSVTTETQASSLTVVPSEFAKRTLGDRLIELYTEIGEEVGVDWSVTAAADQIEGSGSPAEESERAAAIAYTLRSFGAADDLRGALRARNGAPGYAPSVLRLAERYRELDAARAPVARRPLSLPADGQVIAAFGQRLGVLHDGIDIDAPTGTPVRAAAAGLVSSTGFHAIFGEYTCVLHRFDGGPPAERELTTCYGNQSAVDVAAGDAVTADEQIGRVGCTGACVRPHVHFQVRLGSGQTAPVTDPAPFLESATPIRGGQPLESP